MILYIPLEISVRELGGHLLLAAVAVSRGHQVIIASSNDIWLYKRLNLIPQGCFLTKNMEIPSTSKRMYENFLKDGFDLYCQEQEPSMLWSKFEKYLVDRNINDSQFFPYKGVFCWGKRDTEGYSSFFGLKEQVFFETGSPRADLWHPGFKSLWLRESVQQLKPYILVVSNFGLSMGYHHWTESMVIFSKSEILESNEQENQMIRFVEEDYLIAFRMVQAVKYLAQRYPDQKIAIRPHPTDNVFYWKNIFAGNDNVYVTDNTSPLSSWISGASAVMQNGCTSSLEAVLQKIPVISYGPDRTQGDLHMPNEMGVRVYNATELDAVLEDIINGSYADIHQHRSEEILRPLISTEQCNAALKMLLIMEKRSDFGVETRIDSRDIQRMRFTRKAKNLIDGARRSLLRQELKGVNYEFDKRAIEEQIGMISGILGIKMPKLDFLSKTGLLLC